LKTNNLIRLAAIAFIALALFLLPRLWGWPGLPFAILGSLLVLTFFLVRWHARNTGYQCPECKQTFAVAPITDFLSPHLAGVKMLRCPHCGHSSWCPEIERRSVTDPPPENPPAPVDPPQRGTSLRLQITFVLVIYFGLWAYTLLGWPALPAHASIWTLLKIPMATLILPILQVTFCLYALRHGYRSRIYFLVSAFVIVFLILAIWMQRNILVQFS